MPIIGMRHHCNHAYFSYAVSPFAGSDEPVMISVLDGIGDDGAISLYLAQGDLERAVQRVDPLPLDDNGRHVFPPAD